MASPTIFILSLFFLLASFFLSSVSSSDPCSFVPESSSNELPSLYFNTFTFRLHTVRNTDAEGLVMVDGIDPAEIVIITRTRLRLRGFWRASTATLSLLILPEINYHFNLVPSSPPGRSICNFGQSSSCNFILKYSEEVLSAKNFSLFGGSLNYLPKFVSFNRLKCSEERARMRFLVVFHNSAHDLHRNYFSFNPKKLLTEGNQTLFVACRLSGLVRSFQTPKSRKSPAAFRRAMVQESDQRSDSEIIVVLISTTLACLFLIRQLFYVKKHPQFLPFISISMLVLLTLGSLVPLVLPFETSFMSKSDQDKILFEASGWSMADQVAISVVKMVAFLLQLYLLILSWSARSADENRSEIWAAEKKALTITTLLHVVVGGSVGWLFNSSENHQLNTTFRTSLESFGGLALDSFLLPQILVNVFGNLEGKFLSSTFYMGNTAVLLIPRAYYLYHGDGRDFNPSVVHENSNGLFYSAGWNMIVFSCTLLLALVMFAQQNLGA